MSTRESHLSDPNIIRCIKDLLSIGGVSLTISNETYILDPMQKDVRDAIHHASNSSTRDTTKLGTMVEMDHPSIHSEDDGSPDDSLPTCNQSCGILTRNDADIPEIVTDNIETHSSREDDTTEEISVFRIPIIRSQLDALPIYYDRFEETVISDIPNRGDPGSQERRHYINTCFQVWDTRSRFVNIADRLTTVLKIAHMSDLYVLYLEIEEDVRSCPNISTSHGRDFRSIVHDRFCEALPDARRKKSKTLKAEAEKCFAFLMTTGAQKIYDTDSITYEFVRRLKASRVKGLLSAIHASGSFPSFGDYRALVTIPQRVISAPRPLTDSVVPTDERDVQRLLEDNQKHLRSRDVESGSDPRQCKRARVE